MTDTKALIERNNAWPAAMGRGDALSADFVTALLAENSARIAALEAEVARLKVLGDGLAGALRSASPALPNPSAKRGVFAELRQRIATALAAWEKKDG